MDTRKPSSTSEMQVTSIRLEAELKERLRELSGEQGYQTLIREVLWQFVEQRTVPAESRSPSLEFGRFSLGEASPTPSQAPLLSRSDIRATFQAITQQEEQCAITGQLIQPQQSMWLGLTTTGELLPLSVEIRREESTKL
ncbi:hypothetical protein H6F90_21580 [Trichocoleus sp. FACHB-591]|uniref:hypothetical protein n=1 Tax=Trichocoleus sp. FACHB-591 TaxID=2692872 RepID=UPI0016828815|nr:hypothetical protein [Trichocoleus sp. FACHB-591]MBD2097692.1 hypothetical protein [Trichocoleus sp. FACHB-591]